MPDRVFIRITQENVDGHRRIAVNYPTIEACLEARGSDGDEWAPVASLDISRAIKDTRIETEPGGVTKLWLCVVAFDVESINTGDSK